MKTILRSSELTCPSCISSIEKALQGTEGVREAKVHFSTGRIEVEHDPEKAPREDLVRVVERVGYATRVSPF